MRSSPLTRMDKPTFHRLWTALPFDLVDKSFWVALEAFCDQFLNPHSPLNSQTFFSVQHTGRILQEQLTLVNPKTVEACNHLRPLYDTFTLWNPLALAALLKAPLEVVTAQLLLAVERQWMTIHFVVNCRSCGCDIAHFQSVNDISFVGTFHSTNAFCCPMCTDRTEVNELQDVAVYFQLQHLPTIFLRQHHRLYFSEEADRRRLESFFCPAQGGFAFTARLPEGRYLLSAPFCGAFVEYTVELSAAVMEEKDPYLSRIVDLKAYIRSQNSSAEPFGQPIRRRSTNATSIVRRGMSNGAAGGRHSLINTSQNSVADTDKRDDAVLVTNSFGAEDVDAIPPITVVPLKHGKVQFRIFNDTNCSGFIDLFIALDTRTEFSAKPYPHLLRVPHFLHVLPRGMRSAFLTRCIPRPPSTTPTTGVYVRHQFLLRGEEADEPSVISVLREVHRYSLEDHHGLLIGVSSGGTSFDSTFLSTTAALASSICFFQRVLTRLGEPVALAMRCSITEGPLKIAAYQGQYNDADNARSSYPDAQFVGSVVYASNHPPITGHYFYCTEEEAPRVVVARDEEGHELPPTHVSALDKYRSPAWLNEESDDAYDIKSAGTTNPMERKLPGAAKPRQHCLVRFEVRCVPLLVKNGKAGGMSRRDSVCPRRGLREDGSDSTDAIFPYFLQFLREHFSGTDVHEEEHALIVQIPLPMIYAALQMSDILNKKAYMKDPRGPF
ncbi:hypothetical protein ABB37_00515 [Leptomonas pyrrhocoris]|uniref:Uncharacterized protein n=1 Tax=Leptomonas pyrrhocoris TaxID=157538 RepID=A0A0M9GAI7_LEPPY|nr:hypothetical protein ABB37_00515 [Leptomonas pyrrhocoris]KPA86290.1 hypothetical protein ABB37_00515 [Leptomonas pyrrhocoris]|eukprot:XP_015664729.1 hypothetical protein ABB37_00515 [Leptomonas pyrrhocoris]